MIYFDNAATGGRKPDAVLSAVNAAIKVCANPGRSGHKLALSCAKIVQDCRNALIKHFDGYHQDRVIFTKNCTEALNIALFGLLRQGDHVIVSCMEHNSVLRPLEYLRKSGVITYDVCPLRGDGAQANIHPDDISALVKPNTRLAAITTASNVNGAIPPIKSIRAILPPNVLLLCDGAQGGGHLDISMQENGIDLLSLAGHKGLHGIQGSGALLFSERVELTPLLYGGTGSMSISLTMPDFYPDALEAGTVAFPAIISLLEGVRFLQFHQTETIAKVRALCEYFLKGLSRLSAYESFSLPNVCGIVAFRHTNLQSEYIAESLSSKFGIAVRGGLHCAPLMHEALGSLDGGLVRVSFSHFSNEDEIDFLLNALQAINRDATLSF